MPTSKKAKKEDSPNAERIGCRTDKSTLANLDAFTFKHLALDLTVDFEASTLSGSATWTACWLQSRRSDREPGA